MEAGHPQRIKANDASRRFSCRRKCPLSDPLEYNLSREYSFLWCWWGGGSGQTAWLERGTYSIGNFRSFSIASIFPTISCTDANLCFKIESCSIGEPRKARFSSVAHPPCGNPSAFCHPPLDIFSHWLSFPILFSLSLLFHDFLIPLLSF